MTDNPNDSEHRRQWMRDRLNQLRSRAPKHLTPEQQYAQDERDYRLLLATLDGDENRADRVLDEEPVDLAHHTRAAFKQNALEVVGQLEAKHGRDKARRLIDTELMKVLDEAEQHRDPFGHTLQQLAIDDLNAELRKLDPDDDGGQ